MKETFHFGLKRMNLEKKGKFFSHSTAMLMEKQTLGFTWITGLVLTLRAKLNYIQ